MPMPAAQLLEILPQPFEPGISPVNASNHLFSRVASALCRADAR